MIYRAELGKVQLFFATMSPITLHTIADLYAADAYFKDPFNEVRGQTNIIHIFEHMFMQVDAPRFIIKQSVLEESDAFIVWDFEFKVRGKAQAQTIHGSSHLRFNAAGKVDYHRDYWDVAEELYEKVPVLGGLMRWLKKIAST